MSRAGLAALVMIAMLWVFLGFLWTTWVGDLEVSIDDLSSSLDEFEAQMDAFHEEMIANFAAAEAEIKAIVDRANADIEDRP